MARPTTAGEFVRRRDPNCDERAAGAASRRVKRKRGSRGRARGFIGLEKISYRAKSRRNRNLLPGQESCTAPIQRLKKGRAADEWAQGVSDSRHRARVSVTEGEGALGLQARIEIEGRDFVFLFQSHLKLS